MKGQLWLALIGVFIGGGAGALCSACVLAGQPGLAIMAFVVTVGITRAAIRDIFLLFDGKGDL